MVEAILGARTRKPQNSVVKRNAAPRFPLTRSPTAVAVITDAAHLSVRIVGRVRNSTDNMVGSASPKKQAGIQMQSWSRIRCLTQRFQRGRDCSLTAKTLPTCDN